MTRRRWIADSWTAETATLTGDQAAHLTRVLRASPGQVYDVVAGGFLHRAEITSVTEQEVVFTLHEELESDAALPLHLLLAIFKFDHMEWAIEKATELGIARITPIVARRTDKHLALAAPKRADRWRRIALEASKQSRRTTIPTIEDPSQLKPALEDETAAIRILLSETEQATTIPAALTKSRVPHPSHSGYPVNLLAGAGTGEQVAGPQPSDIALAIGPEGGWTADEMALFTGHRWEPVTLGPRILRAETAAVAAIAITSSLV